MFTRVACASLLVLLAVPPDTRGQVSMQTPAPPEVTAENLDWFQSGEPLLHGGGVYYKAGARTHFNRNEMVPSGWFGQVPIYVRPTEERGSVIYVPLAGGVMQPYERRRSGDLAGTVGSSAPGFPVVLAAQEGAGQAPARGFARVPGDIADAYSVPVPVGSDDTSRVPEAVGTTGVSPATSSVSIPTHMQTARRPTGLNGVYLEYDGARWFAAGTAVEFTPDRFTRIGEYHGFPVYLERGSSGVIYVALVPGTPGLVSPYWAR
jgi:hypothetical protein